MKVKIVLVTENNVPAERLGEDPAGVIKTGWDLFLRMVEADSKNEDRAQVVSVEILEG